MDRETVIDKCRCSVIITQRRGAGAQGIGMQGRAAEPGALEEQSGLSGRLMAALGLNPSSQLRDSPLRGRRSRVGPVSLTLPGLLVLLVAGAAIGQWVEKTVYLPDTLYDADYLPVTAYNPVDNKAYHGAVSRSGQCWVFVIDYRFNCTRARIPVPCEVAAMCYNSRDNKVYCSFTELDAVGVISGASDSLIATVPVGHAPGLLCYSPAGSKVYCCDSTSDGVNVTVIDGATNQVLATIRDAAGPLCVNVSATKLYARRADSLLLIDCAADTVTRAVSLGGVPWELLWNPAVNKTYCLLTPGGENPSLLVLDGETDSVLARLPVQAAGLRHNPTAGAVYCAGPDSIWVVSETGDSVSAVIAPQGFEFMPACLTCSPASNKVYCAAGWDGATGLVVINCTTNSVVSVATGDGPCAVTFDSVDNVVYCVDSCGDYVSVISCAEDLIHSTVDVNCEPVALCYSTLSNKVYCASYSSHSVYVIDGATNELRARVRVGRNPLEMCYNSTKNRVYTTHAGSKSVTVIDCSRDSVTATVPVRRSPFDLAYCSTENKVYCANYGGGITVIDGVTNAVLAEVDTTIGYSRVVWNSVSNKLYCARYNRGVMVLDCLTDSMVAVLDSPMGNYPGNLEYNPRSNKVYAYYVNVWVIDGWADTILAVDRRGGFWWASCHNSNGNKVYISSVFAGDPMVLVVGGASDTAVAVIRPGGDVAAMYYDPAGDKVYCASTWLSEIIVVRGETDSILRRLKVGPSPCALAANPMEHKVYVADSRRGSVTVIRDSLTPAIEEDLRLRVTRFSQEPTIVMGTLRLEYSKLETRNRVKLMDATGRSAMQLVEGENDIRQLSPGVYFLLSLASGRRSAASVRKVVVTR